MGEEMITSRKKKYGKKLLIAWIAIAAAFIAITVLSVDRYYTYIEGQDLAIELTLAVEPDLWDEEDEFEENVKGLYEFFNEEYVSYYFNGKYLSNRDVVDAVQEADKALCKLLEEEGYDCGPYFGSYYLKYTRFVDFAANENKIPYMVIAGLVLITLLINLMYILNKRKSMTIVEERIVCRNGKKIKKEFFIRDIKTVDGVALMGIRIRGNSIKYTINLLENAEELKSAILEMVAKLQDVVVVDDADALVKYKGLLDQGIITQEEFDAKKKQLLGL